MVEGAGVRGDWEAVLHEHRLRVLFGDTDAAGIVYHAVYLRYFEAARGELLRARGLPYAEIERQGFFWPVTEVRLRYRSPARYDDELAIATGVSELGGASVTFCYRVTRTSDAGVVCEGATRLACVRKGGGVTRMPGPMREVLDAARWSGPLPPGGLLG